MKHFSIALLTLAFVLSSGTTFASLTQTEVSQLYVAVFGRASEGDGNRYWQSDPASTSMTSTANIMLNTTPAMTYFGPTLDNPQAFIEHIYSNTLGKTYTEDPSGVDYWVQELNQGKTKGEVIAALIVAAQDPVNSGAAQDRFNNKVDVSDFCADKIAEYTDLDTFKGFIDSVTSEMSTASNAKYAIFTSNGADSQSPANGDYRSHTEFSLSRGSGHHISMSKNGYRSVAGAEDGQILLYGPDQETALFTYDTWSDTGTQGQANAVAMSYVGNAFVVGTTGGHLYYFYSDSSTPFFKYDLFQERQMDTAVRKGDPSFEGVAISDDGMRFLALSQEHLYFFEWDRVANQVALVQKIPMETTAVSLLKASNDCLHAVVTTKVEGNPYQTTLYYVTENGIQWQYKVASENGGNAWVLPAAISGDGQKIIIGGDSRAYFFDVSSSSPQWTFPVNQSDHVVSAVAISDDGKRAACSSYDYIFFFDDTSSNTDSFRFNGYSRGGDRYTYPAIYSQNGIDEINYGIGLYPEALSMSRDGEYFLAASYSYGFLYYFHRSETEPIRIFVMDDFAPSDTTLSPDGDWIMVAGVSGEIRRHEVAPVEVLKYDMPVTISLPFPLNVLPFSTGKITVDYKIFKPGRAATLNQHWKLLNGPLGAGVPLVPTDINCTGQTEWSGESDPSLNHVLAEGNQTVSDQHEITLPKCSAIDIGGSVESFILVGEMEPGDKNIAASNQQILSYSSQVAVKFSVSTSN